MNILFVCKANYARSQIAEIIFNSLSKKHTATSAGTQKCRVTGHPLKDFPEHSNLFVCMDEIGYDIRNNVSKLLTPSKANKADIIIVMAEKDTWTEYLRRSTKVNYWKIDDLDGQSMENFRIGRDAIKKLVEEFVRKIG